MDARRERGLQIAKTMKIQKNKLGWQVPSQRGFGSYIVNLDGEPFCTCPDFTERHLPCKHIYAVEFIQQRETKPDGTVIEIKTMKMTYTQDWTNYNNAQKHEQEHFVDLLRDLCNGIPQPEQKFGRPRLPLSDMIFGIVYRTYTNLSGRRFTSYLKEVQEAGLINKTGCYNSGFNYLDNPALTWILKSLIEQSASPLKSVETDFAVDSSGFATTTYDRWFDYKYGKEHSEAKWIKTHLMCGVKTHVVTSVEITPAGDATQLPQLVSNTAKNFNIKEVSADKAYSSRNNLHAVEAVNAVPYIPFKNTAVRDSKVFAFDGLYDKMFHYFNFNKEAFYEHYHKRSNVETAFSMIKMKFGTYVKAKTPTAQTNEVLCKILCHNICCVIEAMYELGIEPIFYPENN